MKYREARGSEDMFNGVSITGRQATDRNLFTVVFGNLQRSGSFFKDLSKVFPASMFFWE
jgi:hypothetical protein